MRTDKPLKLARALEERGDLAAAEATYRQIAAKNPADEEALFGLGTVLRKRGLFGESLDVFARSTASPAARVEAFLEASVTAAQAGLPKDAAAWLARAERRYPDRYEPLYFMGCLLASSGRDGDALFYLERAQSLAPKIGRAS